MSNTQQKRVLFTKEMRKNYTILIPNMLPTHFRILRNVFRDSGYHVELMTTEGPAIAQTGLKYVHNDTCYPALLVIGQLIEALESGKYDVNKTALMITQTGGGCRASNYIHLLRKALEKAGLGHVPVISLNMSGLEANPGFKLTIPLVVKVVGGLLYGDALMHLSNQTRPYELQKGATDETMEKWVREISGQMRQNKGFRFRDIKKNLEGIVRDFENIALSGEKKTKVGVVGEIYVKYASLGNNNLERFLQDQDCEYCLPGIMGFALFKIDNRLEDIKLYGGNPIKYMVINLLMKFCTKLEGFLYEAVAASKFVNPGRYAHTKTLVDGVIGYGSKMGEGWLLTAEMLELVEQGYPNIVCTQPFGCLPNHINGRGMMNRIREVAPTANIVAIDYDPGAARVNQENRIKLMLASAKGPDDIAAEAPAQAAAVATDGLGAEALSAKSAS